MNRCEFRDWIEVKVDIHERIALPNFSEGEIWWCAVGRNVGVEINGKSKTFARPVIVLRKLNKRSFMAIPLTSKRHEGTWYVSFSFKGIEEYAALAQSRIMSAARLYQRIGRADETDMFKIRIGFCDLFCD